MGLLDGKRALVTGSTSGIGRAIAVRMAEEGAKVVVSGRNEAKGREVVGEIASRGGDAVFVRADLRKPREAERLVDEATAALGGLDIVVNNAGVLRLGGIEDLSIDDWEEVLAVNLTAPFVIIRRAVRYMGRGGVIINISSTAGLSGYPGGAAYCASKAGLIMLSRVASLELAGRGIRVVALAPGVVDTPMIRALAPGGDWEGFSRVVAGRIPLGFIAEPRDIAEVVVFLASDKARYITGSVLVVDGGLIAGRRESGVSPGR